MAQHHQVRSTAAVVVAVIVVLAQAGIPARGAVKYVQGYAHVANNTGAADWKQGISQFSAGGGAMFGTAFASGAGMANYNIHPAIGSASVFGQSSTLTFEQWAFNHRETQADAFMKISDSFTVEGPIDGSVLLTMHVNYSGTLMPNTEFESRYLSNFGTPTITAQATVNLFTGWLDSSQNLHDTESTSATHGTGVTQFNASLPLDIEVDEDFRTYGFILTLGGIGLRGGGFNFAGNGNVESLGRESSGPSSDLSSAAADGFPDSFFEIVVELPPGLNIRGDSGYYIRSFNTPEPGSLAVLTLAVPTLLRRCQSRAHSAVQCRR